MSLPAQRDHIIGASSLIPTNQGDLGSRTTTDSHSTKPNAVDNAQKSAATKEPISVGTVRNMQGLSKQGLVLNQLKGVHFAKSSGRSTPRRSSSRSIKRKKFDDELVESSLKNPGKPMGMPEMDKEKLKKLTSKGHGFLGGSLNKKQKKNKGHTTPLKDLGRWRPADDLTLITAVLQTNDLNAVHVGCKFSCRFTMKDIQDRWYALLYDPVASRLATYGMKQLPPDVIIQIQSNTLWSKEEEALLAKTSATTTATMEYFQRLLDDNPTTFHPYRTAKSTMEHWLEMKHYQLLDDQTVPQLGSATATFSDFEDQIKDSELTGPKDEALERELDLADRRAKHEIRQLEEEVPRWQAIVDGLTESGTAPTEFDPQTLAVLRGRLVRYLMRSREITVGRSTKDNTVDVDLSLEGPACKVSRKQAVIRLKPDGEYYVVNEGRRPLFVDGKSVLTDVKAKLHHNSTFEADTNYLPSFGTKTVATLFTLADARRCYLSTVNLWREKRSDQNRGLVLHSSQRSPAGEDSTHTASISERYSYH